MYGWIGLNLVWGGLWVALSSGLLSPPVRADEPPTTPPQVPLCMIGDSITWSGDGDYWRQYLLTHLPNLAFVGAHSAVLGYSHAGEGGNRTTQVLARLAAIPDCPYYHLLIGTNDDASAKAEADVEQVAAGTAERIVQIVTGLLAKPSVQRVFLASVLPCETDNPFRDQANAAVNALLRPKLAEAFPGGKVVWVEYEQPLRATPGWGPLIRLHPTKEGYQLLARLLAEALRAELKLPAGLTTPRPRPGGGVRITNLWAGEGHGRTTEPLIAGWYTLSFDLAEVAPEGGTLVWRGEGPDPRKRFEQTWKLTADQVGKRQVIQFFTGYAGYQYTTSVLTGEATGGTVERVLLEKRRPSGLASVYGAGSYLDTTTPPAPGELIESPR